ncbi:MAG: aminotransferase class V-fold PLP-dependent enzyme [Planctomycetota bacterium]
MPSSSRIYLDNAATSFPKPESVYAAVDDYQRRNGSAIGRGTSRESVEVQRIADKCRQSASLTLGAEGPDRIVFTFNGTDGLNLALFGLCRPGDHVITTEFEHNSVLRPLRWLKDHQGVDVTVIRPGPDGQIDPTDVREQIRTTTRLIAVQHASNVTGVVQPVEAICELARQAGILTLVDAAQTAGHWPINLADLPADLLACPGHKGLLGPLGTGLVYVRPGLEHVLECYRLGGTGTQSEDDRQPDQMPDRYEAGNHNAPGLAGLGEGLAFVRGRTVEAIRQTEAELIQRLVSGLKASPGVTVYGHQPNIPHVGVVAFNVDSFAPQEVASILDETFGIQSRAGLHCAPGVHRFLGTFDRGGTVRFSVGVFSTADEVDQAIAGVRELANCSP